MSNLRFCLLLLVASACAFGVSRIAAETDLQPTVLVTTVYQGVPPPIGMDKIFQGLPR